MYHYSGSIWTSIIAHFITNAVQVLAVAYGLAAVHQHISSLFLLSLVGLFVVVITLLRMKRFWTCTRVAMAIVSQFFATPAPLRLGAFAAMGLLLARACLISVII